MPVFAARPLTQSLDSGWEFRALSASDHPEVATWHPATVPGVVQTDLLQAKLIPDPFYGDNESRLQWIGLTDWEYRATFRVNAATLARQHVELVFDGLDTYAQVELNGKPLLAADNMFRTWRVDAKPLLRSGANQLRVVFRSPVTSMIPVVKALPYILPSVSTANAGNEENVATAPYTRKAPYQYGWDWGPRYITIGIWKPVRLEAWDGVRIAEFYIHQLKVTSEVAELAAELRIEATKAGTATIAISHDNPGAASTAAAQTVELDAGTNNVSIPLRITQPRLWYPAGYGAQNRLRFTALVRLGRDRQTAATAEVKTGLRSIELRRATDQWGKSFTFVVNGIPVFAKGANVIPFDSFPTRVTPERHRQILQAAHDAHMNMVREWGGGIYESDDFYDICDELGLMVWQEFMFGGDMVPGDLAFQQNVRQEAIDQVEAPAQPPQHRVVVRQQRSRNRMGSLGRPRCLPRIDFAAAERARLAGLRRTVSRHSEERGCRPVADPVPYWPSSPSADFETLANNPDNGDMHFWNVWHALAPIADYNLQHPRFMSEFGFQSFPEMRTIRSFAQPADLAIDSTVMKSHQKNHGGNERILTYMLREYPEPRDFASFVYLSQVQQAEAIKVGAEQLRRARPRTMGSLYWQLNDCWPVASWSSIDYYGRWKALQYYARRFYDDVLISPVVRDGNVDIYVVSDKLQSLSGQIQVRLLDFSGKVLLDQTKDVQLPPQSSAVYLSLSEKDLLKNADPKRTFLVADFRMDQKSVSRNLVFFDAMRNLDLPQHPGIEASLARSGQEYALTLRSPVLARNVYVSFGDEDVAASDNYFDLLPGEAVTIELTTSASLEQLRSALKVESLVDAFGAERPDYRVHPHP